MSPSSLPDAEVIDEVRRILASPAFDAADRASALLRFLVEQTLAGRADRLKEFTIGAEALGKGDHFDPRTDPIVRAEMSRLRNRLERYYAAEGGADAVVIAVPKGTYVPRFERRPPATGVETPRGPERPLASILRPLLWFALGAGAAGLIFLVVGRRPAGPSGPGDQPLVRLDVSVAADGVVGSEVGADVALSPDGTRLVFVSRDADGIAHLNVRRLDQSATVSLPETDGARIPFFSPDGRWVGFWASGKLKKVPVDGGAPIVLCDATDLLGGSWGDDDTIVAASLLARGKLWRIPASGGTPAVVADLTKDGLVPQWPQALPGGRILFTAAGTAAPDASTIELLSLDGRRRTLVRGGTYGRYLPGGYLIYVNQGTLYGVRVDLDHGAVQGAAVPVLNGIGYSSTFGFAQMAVSRTGTLVYRKSTGAEPLVAVWLDATGRAPAFAAGPARYLWPRVSPDGTRLALAVAGGGSDHIAIYDRLHDRPAAVVAEHDAAPLWTRDGRRLVVAAGRGMSWVSSTGGEPHPIVPGDNTQIPWSFAPDGRLAYHQMSPGSGFDLWTVPIASDASGLRAGTPTPFLRTPAFEVYPSFSPDGHWIAYGSNQSGAWEVYVRAFPDTGRQVQVSVHGGRIPRWSPNGHDLIYRTDDQRLMVTPFTVKGRVFTPGAPRAWSPARLADTGVLPNFDVAPDGRVLALMPAQEDPLQNRVTFVLNFFDELHRRLGDRD
ncbi:MAG TPA: hypothetical protein VFX12_14465 [Vicinamibacterales bacterium]|nr:hypothetical protein [Vicinamibacterales bacterium]